MQQHSRTTRTVTRRQARMLTLVCNDVAFLDFMPLAERKSLRRLTTRINTTPDVVFVNDDDFAWPVVMQNVLKALSVGAARKLATRC